MTEPNDTTPGAHAFAPVAVPATGASTILAARGRLQLGGWSLREATGTASALVQIVDGDSNGNTVVAEVALQAGESVRDQAPHGGIQIDSGLFLVVLSGTVQGAVWVRRA